MRLGTLLLRDAIITLTQLEQAIRAQVLNGGKLGTNLVELGFLDVNTLGRYLARVLDVPLAIADRFEKADSTIVELFGVERADRYTAVPLGFEKDSKNTLGLAMRDPSDHKAIATIEKELEVEIQPYIAAELRLLYYLERFYGLKRKTRYLRMADGDGAPRSRVERRHQHPHRGISTPPPVRIEPRSKRKKSRTSDAPARSQTTFELEAIRTRLDGVEHRDQIAEAMLDYMQGRFECAALFLVRQQNAMGWRARAPGMAPEGLERLAIPLGGASVFQSAHDSGRLFRGKADTPGHPVERQLWSALALEREPTDIVVLPVKLSSRVVNLVYGHAYDGKTIEDRTVSELLLLAEQAEQAYVRLIAAAKKDL